MIDAKDIQVGVIVPHWTGSLDGATPRWDQIREFTHVAEECGLDSLWMIDDLLITLDLDEPPGGTFKYEVNMVGGEDEPIGFWECWSVLAALAASTKRPRLGTLITNNNFRAPALLAKMADTIDEISGGRLVLGLGAGNNESEHTAFGLPWARRYDRFEQAVPIISTLLRTGKIDTDSDDYTISRCRLEPRGPSERGPRIMLGGRGPRVVALAAEFADQWNVWVAFEQNSPELVAALQEAMDQACEAIGRDPATLERSACVAVQFAGATVEFCGQDMSAAGPLEGPPSEVAERLAAFGAAGISDLQVYLAPATAAAVEEFANALKVLRA